MYRRLAIAALWLCPAVFTSAQSRFDASIMAGPVTSQISGDALGGWDKYGFAAGAMVWMKVGDNSTIDLGMQYITKGSAKQANPGNNDFNKFAYRLNYIDIPVMYTYHKDPFLFSAGLYAGVLVHQSIKSNSVQFELNPPFENLDIGATGGAAVLLGEKWILELRGETSIIPTRPAPNVVNKLNYYERGNYNQVLQLMLHYRLGSTN